MLTTRRPRKKNKTYVDQSKIGKHELVCCECADDIAIVSTDIAKFTCSRCVQKMCAPPENYIKKNSEHEGFPRGWHFKKRFEAPNGKVYSFGKLVEEDIVTDEVQDVLPKERKRRTSKKAINAAKKGSAKKVTRRGRRPKNEE